MIVKLKRIALCMTQTELEELSGVSRATISHIEGGYLPSVRIAKKLADVLGIDWRDIYILE